MDESDSENSDSEVDFESSSSEDEEALENTRGVDNSEPPSDLYVEATLKEEEAIEHNIRNMFNEKETKSKLEEQSGKIERVKKKLLRDNYVLDTLEKLTQYRDITPLFVDGAPFFIDASALITCVMKDENYCSNNGGQTLHFVYLAERIIKLICRKGGTCELVFFKDKELIFQEIPEYSLLISILKIHICKNTDIKFHEIDSVFSSDFKSFMAELNPCFIVMDFDPFELNEPISKNGKGLKLAKQLFLYYNFYVLTLGLYSVDISFIKLNKNQLLSYSAKPLSKNINNTFGEVMFKFSNDYLKEFPVSKSIHYPVGKCKNLKHFIAVQVATAMNKKKINLFIGNYDLVKLYLFYSIILDCFPLKFRCFDPLSNPIGEISEVINVIIHLIDLCLKSDFFGEYDCSLVADLWHGNLFLYILWLAKNPLNFALIGDKVKSEYEYLLEQFNQMSDNSLKTFPILSDAACNKIRKLFEKSGKIFTVNENNVLFLNDLQKTIREDEKMMIARSNQTMQPLNEAIKYYCSDIISSYYSTEELPLHFNGITRADIPYKEIYHWHSLRPLTNAIDLIKDNNKLNGILPLKKQMRGKAKFARYMEMYGKNLMGKSLNYEPIIVCKSSKNNKKVQKKVKKISKASLKIINENKMKKQNELLGKENSYFESFLMLYKSGKVDIKEILEKLNQTLAKLRLDETITKLLFYKLEILFGLWRSKKRLIRDGDKNIDLTDFKELFLVLKKLLLLTSNVDKSLLTEKQNTKIGTILCRLGFKEIAEKWNLPIDENKAKCNLSINMSNIRFQLTHLGPELERKIEGKPDDRVTDFIPDPWQVKLFDIVDRNESALIIAPTSSGKTYASYYCMKKVLKESNTGRIVYVSPTKALVNQVAATIYAKFKNKKMPPGMSVYGIFTRDYKMHADECQILVTVPECLEILLMSPRKYSWAKSLRYVIFDEIHCLAGQAGGISWERCLMLIQCPFIALSATIENPREFADWMTSVEDFKKQLDPQMGSKVNLLIHSDRHNDLVRYIYGSDNKLHHFHPYANLTDYVLKVYEGIPLHLSLDPAETIELYDVMLSVNPKDEGILKLNPEKYFADSKTGFIFRQDVKDYQNELKSLLEFWFKTKRDLFMSTIKKLYHPISEYVIETKNIKYFIKNIVTFTKYLQSKNMLPALVFSYNREYCEKISAYLASYFSNKENQCRINKCGKKVILKSKVEVYDEDEPKNKKGSNVNKKERCFKRVNLLFPVGLTNCNVTFSLRGKQNLGSKDLQFIERRLKNKKIDKNHRDVKLLRRGIGQHHGGIKDVVRQSVEMLFRSKFLNVVFATGTLALGIHMPCKTVVIMGDSPFLNTQEYQQMSGRSGRRGFDKTGNVVFFGLDINRIKALSTSKLPRMIGNFPLSVCYVLRLLLLLSDVNENDDKKNDQCCKDTFVRVLSVLNESMMYKTEKRLKDQMKHFVLFSCQLLMIQRLIDNECRPKLLSGLITHIHYHEPGNLAFIYLLRNGILVKMCKLTPEGEVSKSACRNVINLLARLFTYIPLRNDFNKKPLSNSIVRLPPLPDYVTKALEEYNKEVKEVYKNYFKGFSQNIDEIIGEDKFLPLSKKKFEGYLPLEDLCVSDENDNQTFEMLIAGKSKQNKICSAFAGLSGMTDDKLYCQNSLISNIRHQVFTDCKVVPLLDINKEINGYAYDFYNHGIVKSIIADNGLHCGQDYDCLKDFLLLIKSIQTSFQEIGMFNHKIDDLSTIKEEELENLNLIHCVSKTFSKIRSEYETLFNHAY